MSKTRNSKRNLIENITNELTHSKQGSKNLKNSKFKGIALKLSISLNKQRISYGSNTQTVSEGELSHEQIMTNKHYWT